MVQTIVVKNEKGKGKGKQIAPMSEREKERAKLTIPFDKAKELVNNLSVLFDTSEALRDWEIVPGSFILKGKGLAIKFSLKDTAVERIMEEIDPNQKKIDDFADPDDEDEDD